MPLREISSINDRLDAVEDILNHPSFESQFADVAKVLPDLERIVARIHAKSCKIKDFLKVLNVRGSSYLSSAEPQYADAALTVFQEAEQGHECAG